MTANRVTAIVIHGRLSAAGIELRPPGRRRTSVPVGEAIGLYAAGQTMAQLAGK